jgi:hypothetical protein
MRDSSRGASPSQATRERLLLAWMIATLCLLGGNQDLAEASIPRGTIQGRVSDEHDRPIAGVEIRLSGPSRLRTTTDATGSFWFDQLAPGRYLLVAISNGFKDAVRQVNLSAETVADADLLMRAALSESITVTTGPDFLSSVSSGNGLIADDLYFQRLPSLHDSWAVLQSLPGALLNRLNVGGNETGDQAFAVSRGAPSDQSSFTIDDLSFTDMVDTGMAPMFFDFEQFESARVRIGGSDPLIQTAGVQVNLVTKSRGNRLRASARTFFSSDQLQQPVSVPNQASPYLTSGASIKEIRDAGMDIGGALWEERLSAWFSYSHKSVSLNAPRFSGRSDFLDVTELETIAAKVAINPLLRGDLSLFILSGDHQRSGEGAGVLRPHETSYDRKAPSRIAKLDFSRLARSNLLLSAQLADADFRFRLHPAGGDQVDLRIDPDGVYRNSYYVFETERPQRASSVSLSTARSGRVYQQMTLGAGFRAADGRDHLRAPGTGTIANLEDSDLFATAIITRPSRANVETSYAHLYASDRVDWGSLSVDAGVRWDVQRGRNLSSSVPANPLFPDLLPAVGFRGDEKSLVWRSLAPRLTIRYAPSRFAWARLRGSYNRYYDQLSAGEIARGGPLHDLQTLSYSWLDWNRDQTVQPDEISGRPFHWSGVDPNRPEVPIATSRIDYRTRPPVTSEISVGAEIHMGRNWIAGFDWSDREKRDLTWLRSEKSPGVGDFHLASDYELAGVLTGRLPSGASYTAPYHRLRAGVDPPTYFVLTNRPDYSQHYRAIDLTAARRFANRWGLRAYLHLSDWSQKVGEAGFVDPTPLLSTWGCSRCDGSAIVELGDRRFNPKSDVYVNAHWSSSMSGLYQLSRGFTFATTAYARQGYPVPYYRRVFTGDGTEHRDVLVSGVDETRLPVVFELDLRLSKEIRLAERFVVLGSLDVFNLFDRQTVLARQARLSGAALHANNYDNRIVELQSPRVLRLGIRLIY